MKRIENKTFDEERALYGSHGNLCFEKSDVEATITTPVISIKNPHSGRIVVPEVGEMIMDDPEAKGEVVLENVKKNENVERKEEKRVCDCA